MLYLVWELLFCGLLRFDGDWDVCLYYIFLAVVLIWFWIWVGWYWFVCGLWCISLVVNGVVCAALCVYICVYCLLVLVWCSVVFGCDLWVFGVWVIIVFLRFADCQVIVCGMLLIWWFMDYSVLWLLG